MGNVTFDRILCNLGRLPDAMNFTNGYPLGLVSKPTAPTAADLVLVTLTRPEDG